MAKIAQIEPSYDDLAFEHKMTWEQFVEWAQNFAEQKNICFRHDEYYPYGEFINLDNLTFYSSGDFATRETGEMIGYDLSYESMQTIIKILLEK